MTVLAKTLPSTGFIAGRKVCGYVPAGKYRIHSKKSGKTCIVPAEQPNTDPYEGAYYWVHSFYLNN